MNARKGLMHFVCFIKKHFIFLWPKIKGSPWGTTKTAEPLAKSGNQQQIKKKTTNAKKTTLKTIYSEILLVINDIIMTRGDLFF